MRFLNSLRRTCCYALLSLSALKASAEADVAPKQPLTPTTPLPNQPSTIAPTTQETPDTPGALWVAAAPQNYNKANRPHEQPIDMVVIHDIEGSAEGAVSWFQNPKAQATSHYVVSSMTGRVWQMVKEHDIAWHAGNWQINQRSIGIEHEGYAYRPGFYNAGEYETSARLVRAITARYNIPRDRTHIIGHAEVPNPNKPGLFGGASGHTDPGPYWDWDYFMALVRNDATASERNFPTIIHPGELLEASASFTNTGDDAWPSDKAGRADPALQARGPVYLGIANPEGQPSPFFNYKFWTSPHLASESVAGEVAPGGKGRFAFSLLGPRQLGEMQAAFRLTKVAPAPRAPVPFGETITATIRVEPWDIVQTATQPGFSAPGWTIDKSLTLQSAAQTVAPAEWKFTLPISGLWDVYARWPGTPKRSYNAVYEIAAGNGLQQVTVDQRTKGEWHLLGRYRFDDPGAVKVRLTPHGGKGSVVADAIRCVGPFSIFSH